MVLSFGKSGYMHIRNCTTHQINEGKIVSRYIFDPFPEMIWGGMIK